MKLNNKKRTPYFIMYGSAVLLFLIGGIGLYLLETRHYNYMSRDYLLIAIPAVFAAIFCLRGRQIFDYDSEGEAIHFRNRCLTGLLGRASADEFPKYKLVRYDMMNLLIMKRLYVTVTNRNNKNVILRYDISYLSAKERAELKNSLQQVVDGNRAVLERIN